MAFSDETVEKALKNAEYRCECTRALCDHPRHQGSARCIRGGFTMGDRGVKWEPHHKVAVVSGGSDALSNCEVLCGPRTKSGTCHYHVHR